MIDKKIYKNTGPYSIRIRITQIICGILLFSMLLMFWLTSYFSSVLKIQTYDSLKQTMTLYNEQVTAHLNSLGIYLFETGYYNTSITMLNTPTDQEYYNYVVRVKNLLNSSLPAFSEADGLFVYAPGSKTYVPQNRNTSTAICSDYIREYMYGLTDSGSLNTLEIHKWFLQEVDGHYYFIRIIDVYNSYIGAWLSVDSLLQSFGSLKELNAIICYLSEDGEPVANEFLGGYTLQPHTASEQHVILKTKDGQEYLTAALKLSYCDYYLFAAIPLDTVHASLIPMNRMIVMFFLFFAFAALSFLFIFNKLLKIPLLSLKNLIASLKTEILTADPSANDTNCLEVIEINQTFNLLLEKIHNLRIDIYEKKIMNQEIEMQYLKSQTAPHFLINCLYTICTLANDSSRHEITQQMIETLSAHLRYTLSSRLTVSLQEEIQYTINYLELTNLRFPGCLTWFSEIDPQAHNAAVFPLILLMFTENTIKVNMVMDEELTILLRARVYLKDNEKRLLLSHIDSGKGFSEDFLHTLRNDFQNPERLKEGASIGMYNINRRLKLFYGDTATMTCSNEPNSGARIDLDIPYLAYSPAYSEDNIYYNSEGNIIINEVDQVQIR